MNELNQSKSTKMIFEEAKTLLKIQKELDDKMQEIMKNESVQKYLELSSQAEQLKEDLNILTRDFKNNCDNNRHNEALLFVGYESDRYENGNYMMTVCLNCGKLITIPNIDREQNLILDGKKYFPEYFPFHWTKLSEKLISEYHRLQECYYENPDILKETEKSKKMIYKVMKKRCEEKAND